jgi:transposase
MSDKRVLLLHENAQPHTAHAIVNLLERWGWEIFQHPPYSPDLAPLDFHLFPNMKKHLHAKRFKSHHDVILQCIVQKPENGMYFFQKGKFFDTIFFFHK